MGQTPPLGPWHEGAIVVEEIGESLSYGLKTPSTHTMTKKAPQACLALLHMVFGRGEARFSGSLHSKSSISEDVASGLSACTTASSTWTMNTMR